MCLIALDFLRAYLFDSFLYDRLPREKQAMDGRIGNGGLLRMYFSMVLILFNLGGEIAIHTTLKLNHLWLLMD